MAAQNILILPALDGGDAIVATVALEGYETRRVPSAQIPSLDVRDPILILPGQLVRLFDTELPKAARKQQRQMARFAREDDIAANADTIHYALSADQPPKLAVIDKTVMDSLIETLGALKPKAAYADYDLLTGDTALLVLDRAVEPGQAAVDLDWTEETLGELSDAELAMQFSEGLAEGRGLNLLQGDYRSQSNLNIPRVPSIRFGALAAGALLALLVWNGVTDRAATAQAEELRAQTAADYLAATGNNAPPNPGRAAAKTVQSGPIKAAGFLDLSNILFTGLSAMEDVRVDQLRFSSKDGTLRLRIIYPDFDAAGRVETAISQAGGTLKTGGVREQDGAFVGEATLSIGAGS